MLIKTTEEQKKNPMTVTLQGSVDLSIVKLSNQNGEYASKAFKSRMEAYKVYEKLVSWMVFGLYSQNERWQFLIHGTIDEEKEKKTCQDAEPVDRK